MATKINKSRLLSPQEDESLRAYEVPVVLVPILPEDVKDRVVPAISDLAEKLGGKISVKEDWGKRHLAYEIKGNEEGYYIFFKLEISPVKVKQFEEELGRMTKDVLRFLVIREDKL